MRVRRFRVKLGLGWRIVLDGVRCTGISLSRADILRLIVAVIPEPYVAIAVRPNWKIDRIRSYLNSRLKTFLFHKSFPP